MAVRDSWQLTGGDVYALRRRRLIWRAHLCGTTGERPSSGAAGSELSSTIETSKTPLLSDVAAPEDGRSPVRHLDAGGTRKMRLILGKTCYAFDKLLAERDISS